MTTVQQYWVDGVPFSGVVVIDPATGQPASPNIVTLTGPVTVSNEVEVKNDSGSPIPVAGPLTDTQLRANAIATLQGLSIPAHDYVSLSYTSGNVTGVTYKTGGSAGTTVATLTLAYDGSGNLTSVART